jgi:hypothetical protein
VFYESHYKSLKCREISNSLHSVACRTSLEKKRGEEEEEEEEGGWRRYRVVMVSLGGVLLAAVAFYLIQMD